MIGLAVTKTELDGRAGDLARTFQRAFQQAATLKAYVDAALDVDLTALGYAAGDIASLRSAVADLGQLATIWTGSAALPVAKDFRIFVSRAWGVGAF